MNIRSLARGLDYLGQVESKRQTYHVFGGERLFLLLSFKPGSQKSGNFNIVEADAVEYACRKFAGRTGLTSNDVVAESKQSSFIRDRFDALNVLYTMVATQYAKIDKRHKTPQLFFNVH